MELNEAVRRILGQHWVLILLIALIPVELVAVLHMRDTPTYTASARVVLDTADPKSGPESTAIADTAKAIATSPAQVADALREARAVGRDPVEVAREHVQIRGLGSSGILQLSVTDSSPEGAVAIVNALAAQVIKTRLQLTSGQVRETLASLDRRIEEINRQLSRVGAKADTLVVAAANATDPQRAKALRAERDETLRSRDFLAQQRAVRESERVNLLSTLAVRPKSSVISPASPPAAANPSGVLPDLVLALLLGLVLGVGCAGLRETLQPTLVGPEAIARELDAPLLATLAGTPADEVSFEERSQITSRLRMSAEAARVRSVTLLAGGEGVDVEPLARCLDGFLAPAPEPRDVLAGAVAGAYSASRRGSARPSATEGRPDPSIPIRVFGVDVPAIKNSGATGLVVVVPATMKKERLAGTKHLLRVSPAPLLGVITHRPAGPKGRRRSRSGS
jgi:capsular polysaccharide biosynthesis protein